VAELVEVALSSGLESFDRTNEQAIGIIGSLCNPVAMTLGKEEVDKFHLVLATCVLVGLVACGVALVLF